MSRESTLAKFAYLALTLTALHLVSVAASDQYSPPDYQILLPFWLGSMALTLVIFRSWKHVLQLVLATIGFSLSLYKYTYPPENQLLTASLMFIRWPLIIAVTAFEGYFIYRIAKRLRALVGAGATIPEALQKSFSQQLVGVEIPDSLQKALVADLTGMWTLCVLVGLSKDYDKTALGKTQTLDPGVPRSAFAGGLAIIVFGVAIVSSSSTLIASIAAVVLGYLWVLSFAHCERIRRYGLSRSGGNIRVSMGLLGYVVSSADSVSIEERPAQVDHVLGFEKPNICLKFDTPLELLGREVNSLGICVPSPTKLAIAEFGLTTRTGALR